jgi:hypothetical protein
MGIQDIHQIKTGIDVGFRDITSADATIILTVAEIFPAGFPLEKFSADQSITAEEETFAETRMGVDGHMAAGWLPTIKAVTIMLEADSISVIAMNQIVTAQQSLRRTLRLHMLVTIPAQGRAYFYTNGILKSGIVVPNLKSVQEPLTYKFDFENRSIQLL